MPYKKPLHALQFNICNKRQSHIDENNAYLKTKDKKYIF